MTKIAIPSILLCGLLVCGCDSKSEPAVESFSNSVATLIVPADAEAPSSAQMVTYSFTYDYDNKAMDFAIDGLKYDGKDYHYKATAIPATSTSYFNGIQQRFTLPSMAGADGSVSASNIEASIMTLYGFQPSQLAPYHTAKRQYNITYKVGDLFSVRTFDNNAYYFGTTATSYIYNNEHKEFTTDSPVYNVIMNLSEGTAMVEIHNPVFAAEMPPSMASTLMQLEGLKIEYTHDSYRIFGESIIPKVREGSLMTPMPAFTFKNFMLTASGNDLRNVQISFNVAGKYDAVVGASSAFDRTL